MVICYIMTMISNNDINAHGWMHTLQGYIYISSAIDNMEFSPYQIMNVNVIMNVIIVYTYE